MDYNLANDTWDEAELKAIQKVIDSNRFTNGPFVKQFESDFADYVGSKYAIMVNSGSSANLLAISSLIYSDYDINFGDEIIVPMVSWSTTYYPLSQYGLNLRFVDIDLDTLNIDLDKIEGAITPKTKAVMAVNLLGNPCDFNKLKDICEKNNLILIEDNCESLGATLDGKQAGTFGVVGSYSSYFSHHICTMEGGIVTTDDEDLYHIMLSMRSHGWLREQPENSKLFIDGLDDFDSSFKFILPGYNLRPIEMEGAIGIEQLKKLPNMITMRQKNANVWKGLMADNPNYKIQTETGNSSWFGFSIIMQGDLKGQRKKVIETLTDNGIEIRPIVAGNFLKNPVIKHLEHTVYGDTTNADIANDDGLFIGNQHFDVATDIEKIVDILNSV